MEVTKRRLAVAFGATVAFALLAPAGAPAALETFRVSGSDFVTRVGPVLAGDSVVWAEGRQADRGYDIRVGRYPNKPAVVHSVANASEDRPALAASGSRLVIQDQYSGTGGKYGGRLPQIQVLTGPLEGPFQELSPRCEYFAALHTASIAVRGELVASRGPSCSENQLRDFSPASSNPRRSLPAHMREVRIAGRYLAWLSAPRDGSANDSQSDIVVYDRIADREVYRIPKETLKLTVGSLDVRDDGRVVVAVKRGVTPPGEDVGHYETELAWASASEPYLHKIPVQTRNSYSAKVAGNTIVFVRGGLPMSERDAKELGVTDFSGKVRLLRAVDSEDFDFDGRRIAWVYAGCDRAVINVEEVTASPRIEKRRPCRLRVRSAPKVVDGRVIFDLVCEGDDECFTRHLTLTTVDRFRIDGQPARRIAVGKSRRVGSTTIRLKREAKRLLARRGKLRVRVTTVLHGLPGDRVERRSMIVTLRR